MFKTRHKKLSLRFIQWSRKSYAVFKSVGRHLTIGNIKNVVADRLLGKLKDNLSVCTIVAEKENTFYDDELHDPPDHQLQSELIFLPILNLKKSFGGEVLRLSAINIFGPEAVNYQRFRLFYFQSLHNKQI